MYSLSTDSTLKRKKKHSSYFNKLPRHIVILPRQTRKTMNWSFTSWLSSPLSMNKEQNVRGNTHKHTQTHKSCFSRENNTLVSGFAYIWLESVIFHSRWRISHSVKHQRFWCIVRKPQSTMSSFYVNEYY